MKKLATLITASLLGLGSVASADTSFEIHGSVTVSASASSGTGHATATVIRDHRTAGALPVVMGGRWISKRLRPIKRNQPVIIRPEPRPLPPRPVIVLPAPYFELGTVGAGKQTLHPEPMRLDSLMLEVPSTLDLRQVLIRFTDGQEQKVKFDGYDGKYKLVDLAGTDRQIAGIIVYSKGDRGEIRVLGRNEFNRPTASVVTQWSKLGTVSTGKQSLKFDDACKHDRLALTFSGSVNLNKVLINFANGDTQVVSYDELMSSNSRTPVIDLAGTDRTIAGIIVYTDAAAHGEVTLYAL